VNLNPYGKVGGGGCCRDRLGGGGIKFVSAAAAEEGLFDGRMANTSKESGREARARKREREGDRLHAIAQSGRGKAF